MNTSSPVAEEVRPVEVASAARRPGTLVVFAATVVCAGLVAHRLGEHGFWYDEGATIGTVSRPVGDALWRIFHWELNQSPYHLLALGWLRLVDGEAAMRALSAVFAVAAVPLTWGLGRRLVGERAAVVAAVLVAVHHFVVQWGQQLRGYTLLLALTLASTWLLLRAVERPSTGRAAAYGAVAALSVYAQLFSALVVLAHVLVVLVAVRPLPRRAAVVAAGVGGVLSLPMAEYLVTRDGDPLDWVERPSRLQVVGTAEALAGGGSAQLAVYALVALAGALVLLERARRATDPIDRLRALLPVALLLVPPVVTVAISATVKPLVEARFLIVVVPGLVLVAGAAVDEALRRHRALGGAALAGLLVVSGLGLRDWYERPAFDEWREAVAEVGRTAQPGDVVVTSPSRAALVARHYAQAGDLPVEVGTPPDPEAVDARTVYELARFERDPSDARPLAPEVGAWLADRYDLVEEIRFAGVLVRRHERR